MESNVDTIRIRRGTTDDAETIARHNRAMALETERKELDAARTLAGVRSLFREPSRGFYLIAERDSRVVGQLMVTTEWSDWRNGDFWWIQSVYVVPDARRTGVFSALYRFLDGEARRRDDVCGLRLYVERENLTAQRAYARLGMKRAVYEIFESDFVLG
ncbi:MAG: GNAT family N-acetyltransferase [Deltaproteobacteria bacterium]|nr:GNAT family N-acetyltransferase [Deltaproteobacteria bacterium]